jgi:hypothetical protein
MLDRTKSTVLPVQPLMKYQEVPKHSREGILFGILILVGDQLMADVTSSVKPTIEG